MKVCKKGHEREDSLNRCPECKKMVRRRHFVADKRLNHEKVKAWREKNPDKARNIYLKHKYGITLDQWNQMFAAQCGKCPICDRHQTELKKILFVDHCHKTNKVRELLCEDCNWMIGVYKDRAELFEQAAAYLRKHKT